MSFLKKVFVKKLGNTVRTKFSDVDFLAVATRVSGAIPGAPAIRANPLPRRRKSRHHLTSHMTVTPLSCDLLPIQLAALEGNTVEVLEFQTKFLQGLEVYSYIHKTQ